MGYVCGYDEKKMKCVFSWAEFSQQKLLPLRAYYDKWTELNTDREFYIRGIQDTICYETYR